VAQNRSKPNYTSPYSVALALERPTRILPPLTSCYVVQPMYIEKASILHIIFNKFLAHQLMKINDEIKSILLERTHSANGPSSQPESRHNARDED
jgi:hypothetical protein